MVQCSFQTRPCDTVLGVSGNFFRCEERSPFGSGSMPRVGNTGAVFVRGKWIKSLRLVRTGRPKMAAQTSVSATGLNREVVPAAGSKCAQSGRLTRGGY